MGVVKNEAWHFFRAGGVDQARVSTVDDLRRLPSLDLKLWVALAMPTAGTSLDARTLALLDTDGDGRIRVPELLTSIAWTDAASTSLEGVIEGKDQVAVDSLRDASVARGARLTLELLSLTDVTSVSLADVRAAQ